MKLAIIGNGAIAGQMLQALGGSAHAAEISSVVCLCRAPSLEKARTLFAGSAFERRFRVVTSVEDLITEKPDLTVEVAGHESVAAYGETVLAEGIDLIICSVGALSNAGLHERLLAAARSGGAKMHLPAGAIGAVDLLSALRLAGLSEVTYTSRKPPSAWIETPAEAGLDLAGLREAAVFFEGDAGTAARDYPKNANVAATIALAGLGFERTKVRLIADPAAAGNVHRIDVKATAADFTIEILGKPSAANPRTSVGTGLSVARLVLNKIACEVI